MEQHVEPDLDIVRDPLLREIEFPHTRVFFPYGIPLRVRTNSPSILDAAQQSWGCFDPFFDFDPLELHIGIAGEEKGDLPPPPVYRSRQHLLNVTGDGEHFGVCDFAAGFAYAWLTPRMIADLAAVRYFYLEALGYSLVTERHLTGVHGACVSWRGRGVLLCGETQAGKSTLAYACAREGFAYTSDDGSFLLRGVSGRTVTGNPHTIRFRPSAVELFPELDASLAARRANGKMALEVPTRSLHLPATAARAEVECLVFLHRQPGAPVALAAFPKETARRQMLQSILYGRDRSLRDQRDSLQRLLDAPLFELTYSDLPSAVERLRILLETGG